MYAVSLRAQIKDGRIDELKEFIKNNALPTLEVPGMISIGVGMAFLANDAIGNHEV